MSDDEGPPPADAAPTVNDLENDLWGGDDEDEQQKPEPMDEDVDAGGGDVDLFGE
jgi:hypothetical protein